LRQQGHAGSKTLHQQNRLVLNCGCRLTQVVRYNGRKIVAAVAAAAAAAAFQNGLTE